ncbi:MAG: 4Fe-4S binding protein [Lachnospirales bacterium]
MSNYGVYFSPTGGVKKVVDILVKSFPINNEVDLADKSVDFSNTVFEKDDVVIIAVPSYGGRVPSIVVERISQMKGNGAKVVLVAVFGNRAIDDTLLELKNLVHSRNFTSVAAMEVVAEHSIMKEFGKARPDGSDINELNLFAEKILEKLKIDNSDDLVVPGNQPYKEYSGGPLKPKAGSKCNKCGKCIDRCPVEAISYSNPKETDTKKCISCMRCIAECPNKARKLNSVVVKAAVMGMKKVCSDRKENKLYL